jgi:DNA replicative helicase MCM subunit Mcm2 (Cdc46/Mcm family)
MPKKRTYADRREYLIMAVARRRKILRERAVQYKGGKCIHCGYFRCQAALDFHHIDPTQKEFGISMDGITRSWERVQKELDKCVLVCSNCHREIHAGLLQPSAVMQGGKNGVNSGKPDKVILSQA